MNKTAIKNYAIWARVQLIEAAKQKAYEYAVTDGENVRELNAIGGRLLTETEKKQRRELLDEIRRKGYQQVMEEAAYTWFNRFIALRFMEVNGYLPSLVRVFTDEAGAFKPEILKEAMTVELAGLDRAKVLDLIDKQDNDALYQYLLITQCNALNDCLPQMFERIDNWTELLFPKNLLRPDGVLGKMISMIPEEDWTDQVQIIGWLYQYYNTEPKDKVFENLKKNIKISKENIPAATQLFTPDWIVHYMVENSLGRLWVEGHPNEEMKKSWKYYLEEAEQEPEVQKQLSEIRKEYAKLNPEDIKVIDPCMGSGHILVVLFDVLLQIYESCGYSAREAVSLIVEKNLYGLDIDERAAQLAYFAVMMKARKHDRRFFTRGIQPRVYAIRESNDLDRTTIDYFVNHDPKLKAAMDTLTRELYDAKEYGSILNVPMVDFPALYARFEEIKRDNDILAQFAMTDLLPFVQVAEAMAQKYDVVVTNPPYMGQKGLNDKLNEYLRKHYFDHKFDLFAAFTDRCMQMLRPFGFVGMMTPNVWMFITSYRKLREEILTTRTITNLVKLSDTGFTDAAVSVCSFVIRGRCIKEYTASFVRLNAYSSPDMQEIGFHKAKREKCMDLLYHCNASSFRLIDDWPLTFWAGRRTKQCFADYPALATLASPKQGMATMDTDKYLKMWSEVPSGHTSFDSRSLQEAQECGKRWFPIHKGGAPRKWYGNNEYVVNWYDDGKELKDFASSIYGSYSKRIYNTQYFFMEGATWSAIGYDFAIRYFPQGFTFSNAGMALFAEHHFLLYVIALLNSKLSRNFLSAINESVNFNQGDIAKIPVYVDKQNTKIIEEKTTEAIRNSKVDWDSFETSWNFRKHPLVALKASAGYGDIPIDRWSGTIESAFQSWKAETEERFNKLKANEEELNRIFIDIYGLQDELTPEVEDKDVTVRKADLGREIRSLISYAVGCMFGRYSLDVPGLAYAGGAWDASKYQTFIPDEDNVLPICDDEYFEDDIVARFIKFIAVVYGKESLEENLKFIAEALGGKGTPRQVIRSYFLNDFYADHLKIYQKRPIYWLFDSGKKNGFKCLIYMHRYQPDTIARIRTDYVHEQQERYRSQIQMIEDTAKTASTAERLKLNKQLTKFKDQALELQKYEEKIHHLADQAIPIDLDDGVKVNYAKFEDVLAKIK